MKILVVSHGDFAKGLCSTLGMFFSEHDVNYISLSSEGVEHYAKELQSYLEKIHDDIMILCDLQGGTPYNQAANICAKLQIQDKTEIVAGVNLPMMLELYPFKETIDLKSAKSICETSGKSGVASFAQVSDIQDDAF